jgi:DNA-binding transcriptional regulator YiaG
MGNRCATSLTTLEMLDAVESGISVLRSRRMTGEPPTRVTADAAAALRAELQNAGVSTSEFARAASVSQDDVEAWTAGVSPVPEWVPAALRLMTLLTLSARRKLLYGQAGAQLRPANSHPFSRIEEL